MKRRGRPAVVLTVLVSCLVAGTTARSQPRQAYEPVVGQRGKDVLWVPTPAELVEDMLDMAKVTADDYVIDLGSGDGRIVIAAGKRGARALGIEYDPELVQLSRDRAQQAGVAGRVSFRQGDVFETDVSEATVIAMYLLPGLNMKLRPRLLAMKPGTRVVSHAFTMEDWQPDQTVTDVSEEERTAYLWIVPAKVAGSWTWQTPSGHAALSLEQRFQQIEGILTVNGSNVPLRNATLQGDQISFVAGEGMNTFQYSGRVDGAVIDGTIQMGDSQAAKWIASGRLAAQ